jgi:stage II sporulation protein D
MKKLATIAVLWAFAIFFFPVNVRAEFSHVVRVGLTRSFANRESITVSNASIWAGYGVEEGFMPVMELTSTGGFSVRSNNGQVEILSGGVVAYRFTAGLTAQIMPNDYDVTILGGYRYRGAIEFTPSGARVSAVNVISLEEYLFGVLPSEMSHSFQMEALMAQAVASRTFTFNSMRQPKHRASNFDICDTTCCQVYRGAGTEHERTNEAVLRTYGLMLFYNGAPILANYFSSSGGATENSEDVWNETLPFLRNVAEIAEHNPMVWERTFTWAQLTTAAAANGANIGTVNGVSVTNLGASGRVLQLTLHGTNGSWAIPRSVGVRGFFSSIGGTLPSRNFQIAGAQHSTPSITVTDGWNELQAPLNSFQATCVNGAVSTLHHAYIFDGETTHRINSTPNIARGGNGITINGRGWGHGVGMSQMGAEGMARAGYTFSEILHHYYTDVELRWYE